MLEGARIPFVRPQAGMFVWVDLRQLLPRGVEGWDAERQLTDALFAEERELYTPGEACHAREPGFYRCCFAWVSPAALGVGFARLARFAARARGAALA